MNRIITLLFFISLITCNSFSQGKAEIIYNIKLIAKEGKQEVIEKPSRIMNLVQKEMDNIEIVLHFNNGKSVFKEKEEMELEDKRQMVRNLGKVMVGFMGNYYCDIKKNLIIREHEFDGVNYNITSNFSDINWKLTDEIKNIKNYKCFKATTTRTFKSRKGDLVNQEVIAWYCPDISIPLGPKNYAGLPGLILELNEGGSKLYYATSINNEPNKKVVIGSPKKGEVLTEKEYAAKTENIAQRLMDSMKN